MTVNLKSSFYRGFSILFVIISLIIFFLQQFEIKGIFPRIWLIQAFFFILTVLAHFIASKGLVQKKDFHIFYMLSMAIRLFCCIIFLLIILYSTSNNHVSFVLNFFILYLIYTSFEIYFLLRNLRADFKKDA